MVHLKKDWKEEEMMLKEEDHPFPYYLVRDLPLEHESMIPGFKNEREKNERECNMKGEEMKDNVIWKGEERVILQRITKM